MTSSDSGDDFESADEDFDHSPIETPDTKNKPQYETKPVVVPSDTSLTGNEKSVIDKKLSDQLKPTKQSVDASTNVSNDSNESLNKQQESEKFTHFSSSVLQNVGVPKLSTQSTTQLDLTNPSGKITDKLKEEKSESNKSKSFAKKLGTKLITGIKVNDSPVADSRRQIVDISEKQKVKHGSTKPIQLVEEINDSKSKPINTLTQSKGCDSTYEKCPDKAIPGDGWEVEEEDGFEIPASLAKVSDGSIQCAQEQICEMDQVQYKPHGEQQQQSWGGWGGWGVGSLLSTATGSVSTFSSQVTAGLSTVLETTVGAPAPETLATTSVNKQSHVPSATNNTEDLPTNGGEDNTTSGYGGFGSIVSGVSFLGSTVINRGLDTLETLGKKTMEVLQEGDPGLMKKRAMLFPNQDKPVLSQILREAKEKADHSDKEKEEKETERKAHFESLFDDFQGMVHLEALEMLSTQCELKLQSLLLGLAGSPLLDFQETLSQIRDLCELPDDDDESEVLTQEQFAEQVTKCVDGLHVAITAVKIIKVNDEVIDRLSQLDTESAIVVNQTAISSLAEFTASGMECFHKSAELLLAKQLHNTADEAENYVQLTSHLCARVSAMANQFTQLLTKNDPIANSSLITNIFLEASNSCSYIRNACQLLVPILQVGATS